MNLQHHICLLALEGKLYKSPALKKPQRILDIGTGTGVWAIDCGRLVKTKTKNKKHIGIVLFPRFC